MLFAGSGSVGARARVLSGLEELVEGYLHRGLLDGNAALFTHVNAPRCSPIAEDEEAGGTEAVLAEVNGAPVDEARAEWPELVGERITQAPPLTEPALHRARP